jgi:hypothetical protein
MNRSERIRDRPSTFAQFIEHGTVEWPFRIHEYVLTGKRLMLRAEWHDRLIVFIAIAISERSNPLKLLVLVL